MTAVTRLVTYTDLHVGATTARRLSVSARLEAVLADGRSVVLLDDRGWSTSGPSGMPAHDLERLPHDAVLSERLRAWIA